MSKYNIVKKARTMASNQLHHVRDDMTKRQLQRERKSLTRSTGSGTVTSNASYKFSDIGKWMDADIDDDNDPFLTMTHDNPTPNVQHVQHQSSPHVHQSPHGDVHVDESSSDNDYLFSDDDEPIGYHGYHSDPRMKEDTINHTDIPTTVSEHTSVVSEPEDISVNEHISSVSDSTVSVVSENSFDHTLVNEHTSVVSKPVAVSKDASVNEHTVNESVAVNEHISVNEDTLVSEPTVNEDTEPLPVNEDISSVSDPIVSAVSEDTSVVVIEPHDSTLCDSVQVSDKGDVQSVHNVQTSKVNDDLFDSTLSIAPQLPSSMDNDTTANGHMSIAIDHPLLQASNEEYNYFDDDYQPPVIHNNNNSSIPNSSPENSPPLSLSPLPPPSPPPSLSSPPLSPPSLKINSSGRLAPVVPPRPHSSSRPNSASTKHSTDDGLIQPIVREVDPIINEDYTLISLSLCTLLLYVYYSLNPFVYLAGFMAGFMLFYLTIGTAFVLYVQYSEREREKRKTHKPKDLLPPMDQLPQTIHVDFEGNRTLKSSKFGMVHRYHPSTHHPSQRNTAKVRLYDDFYLEVRYRKTFQTPQGGAVTKEEIITKDLRHCSVLLVPEEVALNRKRRWSKKFPLSISWTPSDDTKKGHLFLFPFTSREKEEWFRRLRAATEGTPYDELVDKCSIFYRYMSSYMPKANSSPLLPSSLPSSYSSTTSIKNTSSSQRHSSVKRYKHTSNANNTAGNTGSHKGRSDIETVRFSATDSGVEQEDDISVSITKQPYTNSSNNISNTTRTSPSLRRKYVPESLPLTVAIGWVNAGMARLAWDLWHEERWKNWVTTRIQRKLIRIKTPPFLEELKVTEVNMGIDMPVLKKPFKLPKLNQQGLWIYLEVEYIGSFTMTIETKLKLEPKGIDEVLHFTAANDHTHTSSVKHRHGNHVPHVFSEGEEISSGSSDEESDTHSLTDHTNNIATELQDITLPAGSDSLSPPSLSTNEVSSPTYNVPGKKEKMLNSMVSKLQKIAAKSRIVARAAEKVSSYPLILTVEVKRLEGLLVLNMAPPPSDAIWYGFTETPTLELIAKPKLGQREVTLSYVTDWIEKKLCEVVEKKLVTPNMEDIVVPVLSSGLPEDKISLIK